MSDDEDDRDFATEEPQESVYTGFWAFLDRWWAPIWLAAAILLVAAGGLLVTDLLTAR